MSSSASRWTARWAAPSPACASAGRNRRVNTPRPVWNPDIENPFHFREHWQDVPDNQAFDNGFKVQWEMFLRHVAEDAPFPHDFLEGARGVQLAELGLKSWHERRWIDVPELEA